MRNTDGNMEFDRDKAKENRRKHGVSFAHAEQALRDPGAVTIEDPGAKEEPPSVTLGMDSLGRLLMVANTPREQQTLQYAQAL